MKQTSIAIVIAAIIIAIPIILLRTSKKDVGTPVDANNVTIVEGKQIINMTAKGGYSPRHSVAKAGMPTILRVTTSGTFDCSSSIRIPGINVSQVLPQTGSTDIDLGVQQAGAFQGTCGMGMYPFDITFE